MFEGRNANDLKGWLASRPEWWRTGIEVVSVDPHEGYRSAITASGLLDDAVIVVDPFHIVRLANAAVTKSRQRVQQATVGHRGWNGDPLYGVRKLLLMAGTDGIDTATGPRRRHSRRGHCAPPGICDSSPRAFRSASC